jgi:hypothetical protein
MMSKGNFSDDFKRDAVLQIKSELLHLMCRRPHPRSCFF